MKTQRLIATVAAMSALMAAWGTASATPYNLLAWYQRSSGGTLSSLIWKAGAAQGCAGPTYQQPCYNPANSFVTANGVIAAVSAAAPTFDWDGTTLTETGLFWATSYISSNPNSTSVISDKVTNFTITPGTSGVTTSTYECVEGAFLITVGANGCKNTNVGADFTDNSTVAYNGGGNPNCVTLTIGGDDYSLTDGSPGVPGTPIPRGPVAVTAGSAGAGCSQTSGAFDNWTIIKDDGNVLILSNSGTAGNLSSIGSCILFGLGPTDGCPSAPAFASISYLVFTKPGFVDTDGDGIPDVIDNCTLVANPKQIDADGDGYGNFCDADINNSGTVTAADFTLLKSVLNKAISFSTTAAASDLNESGTVTAADFTILKSYLNKHPGPSGLH